MGRSQKGKAAGRKRFEICVRLRQGSCEEEDKAMRRGKSWRRRDDGSHSGGGDTSGEGQIGLINVFL